MMYRNQPPPPPPFKKANFFQAFGGLIIILLIALGSMGVYTVQSGYVGVLVTFGEFSTDSKEPGLHFKIPLLQDVKMVDIKMQTAHYQKGNLLTDDGVINQSRITVLDSKNLNIGIDLTVQFIPDATRAKEILAKYGVNYFEKLIGPIIRDSVRDIVSQYQAEDIAKERSVIAEHLSRVMHDNFKGLPFILNAVQLRNIELPKIVRDKIEEVQLAKQEEQRLFMIEKQAEKQQRIKTIEANTKLIEVTTKAKADGEQKKITAEAEAFKIEIQAKAQAEANKKILDSLDEGGKVIMYKALQQWDGKYPQTLVGNDSGLILNIPSLKDK